MRKISNAAELKATIRELELKTLRQEQGIKDNAQRTAQSIKQSFKPAKLLSAGVKQLRVTPDMKTTAINTFVGLIAGTITRKLVVGKKPNILKRTLGTALQAGITRFIFRRLPSWQHQAARLLADKSRPSISQRRRLS